MTTHAPSPSPVSAAPYSPPGKSQQTGGGRIVGVDFRLLTAHVDHRGAFTEIFQDHWGTCLKPVQWSVVHSAAGVMRGVHLHKRHAEFFSVISGRATLGLRDMRPGSPSEGAWSLFEFSANQPACVIFPPGLLHGWYFHEPSIHVQAVSEAYVDYHDEDNLGCFWADPDIGIPWPFTDAIVSPNAKDFPSFRALADSLRGWKPAIPISG